MESPALITIVVGITAAIIVGIIKMVSVTVRDWTPLGKHILVLLVCGAVVVLFNSIGLVAFSEEHKTPLALLLQVVASALVAIGAHNVKVVTTAAASTT